MTIDNFFNVAGFMSFENENDFYHIQIISRKKDNGVKDFGIKEYSVRSVESLYKIENEVKQLCEMFNARAYVYVNKRNYKNIALKMIKELSDIVCDENYKKCKQAFKSCCGKYSAAGDSKIWIIDVDVIDKIRIEPIGNTVHALICDDSNVCERYVDKIRTVSGWHFLIRPCDTRQLMMMFDALQKTFSSEIKEIDIKRDNMTLLYYKEPAK
jgi:hypothetical protein